MAFVRSPSFGAADDFEEWPGNERATSSGTNPFEKIPVRSPKKQEVRADQSFDNRHYAGSPTMAKRSCRPLPPNPQGTPPRQRMSGQPEVASSSSSRALPVRGNTKLISMSSSSSSSMDVSSGVAHFGISDRSAQRTDDKDNGAVDNGPSAWKFQNDVAVTERDERHRYRGDWSPQRTGGAERGVPRGTAPMDRGAPRSVAPAILQPPTLRAASHQQPAGYPTELSPRRTPAKVIVSAPSSISASSSAEFSKKLDPNQSSSSSLAPPPKPKAQPVRKPTQGRNQFTFVKMMEGNKAAVQRPITVEEVAQHNKRSDCWIILSGKVYDVTTYLPYHPGGKSVLAQCAGRDASKEYAEAHPWVNFEQLISKLCLGPVDRKK